MTEGRAEYDRAYESGRIDERLRGHDAQLAAIIGSIDSLTSAVQANTMAIQRLDDRMQASLETVATTAAAVEQERKSTATAVEKARETARDVAEKQWSPRGRLIAVVMVVAAVAGVVVTIYSATRGR